MVSQKVSATPKTNNFILLFDELQINTAIWPDSTIGTPESRTLFAGMRDGGIPKNSVVAHLCGNSEFLSGCDMDPPVWNEVFHPERGVEKPYFVAHPLYITPEAHTVLKDAHVEYVTFGASCLRQDRPSPDQEKAFRYPYWRDDEQVYDRQPSGSDQKHPL